MPPLSDYIRADGYNAWCSALGHERDLWYYVRGHESYEQGQESYGCSHIQKWVNQAKLEARPADEPDWPGSIHLAQMFIGEPTRDETYNENFWPRLSPEHASALRLALAERYVTESIGDQFKYGKVVAGRWKITGQLVAAGGYFNLGIFRVLEIGVEGGRKGILKLLQTEAMKPGMAAREIKVHSPLKHAAVVELYDSYLPTSCHEAPWIITEYCNLKTLKEEVEMHIADGTHATEHFLWEVFMQLLQAVHYCHHGPGNTTWDPISHRDIILSNVFQKAAETSSTSPFANIVKLGDFGCAMPLSEMMDEQTELDSLPAIDGAYCPPEGAVASERGDVYEVGLVMSCIYCEAGNPGDIPLNEFARREWQPWWCDHSEHLKACIIECLKDDPEERSSAGEMLTKVSRCHKELLASGKLKEYV